MSLTAQILFAFCSMVGCDFVWARYVRACTKGKPTHAALWAVAVFLSGGVVVLTYVNNPWMLIPAGLGAFCGTFIGIWMDEEIEVKL